MKKLFNPTPQGYYFTNLGKIPVGGLSLSRFNQIQEALMLSELARMTNAVEIARGISSTLLEEKLAYLKFYRQQLHRILQFTLYFLQIKCDGKTLHNIGVTSRRMCDRLPEIERDLKQHYSDISIDVLVTWQHRGNVELYFKHRYKEKNYRIGKLTEYYKFDVTLVLEDLCSMQPKVLEGEELSICKESFSSFSPTIKL
ncbi:MAG TPA: hypothetical protein V6C71_16625 [Coleofasciculaceae cyanobacterium]